MRKLGLLLLLLSAAGLPFSCAPSKPSTDADSPSYVTTGETSEGFQLLDRRPLEPSETWPDGVAGYRFKYLSDGLEIVGYLFKPASPDALLPLLIFNRGGGPSFGCLDGKTLDNQAFLCSRGFVVLASMYRGSCGGDGSDEFGGADVDDVVNLVSLGRALPTVDPDRVVMLGYSRGGMMTFLAAKRGVHLRAAATVGAPTDLLETYRSIDSWFHRMGLRYLVGDPDENPRKYRARSAVCWPGEIKVPLLILHGEDDNKIGVNQAGRLAAELRALGTPHKLVVLQGGDHTLDSHREERDRLILEWFHKHLPPGSNPLR